MYRERAAQPGDGRPGRRWQPGDPLSLLRWPDARLLAGQDRARQLALLRSTPAASTALPPSRSWPTWTPTAIPRSSLPRGCKRAPTRRASCTSWTTLGNPLHEVDLPAAYGSPDWNGALPAPTLANIDADADLEVVLNTAHSGFVAYDLPGTASARVLWGTGRGSYQRTGVPLMQGTLQPAGQGGATHPARPGRPADLHHPPGEPRPGAGRCARDRHLAPEVPVPGRPVGLGRQQRGGRASSPGRGTC